MSHPTTAAAPEAADLSRQAGEGDSAPVQDLSSQQSAPWPVLEPSSRDPNRWSIRTSAVVVAASLISLVIGSAVGFTVAGNTHTATPVQTTPQQYARVRAANIGPLEEALSHLPSDCSGPDRGRCTLSIAYALALTQKFQAELLPAPACLSLSDAKLRIALVELDGSLHTAALDNALGRLQLAGVTNLALSDALFVAEACASAAGSLEW
jgi:hypothetical protein